MKALFEVGDLPKLGKLFIDLYEPTLLGRTEALKKSKPLGQ